MCICGLCVWCVFVAVCLVCIYGPCVWCVFVGRMSGVCLWAMCLMCICGPYVWCVFVGRVSGVYLWAVCLVCICGLCVWCGGGGGGACTPQLMCGSHQVWEPEPSHQPLLHQLFNESFLLSVHVMCNKSRVLNLSPPINNASLSHHSGAA